jgi:uncharacterized lipoprotein YmbA
MPGRLVQVWAAAMALVLAAGCGSSPPAHFYLLNATATAANAAPARYAVVVGPVSIPASVDQPQFVIQTSPNAITKDEFHRWGAPLQDEIGRIVAADLATLLGTPRVTATPLPHFDAAYRVAIDVQRFESVPGKSATIEAVWVVYATAGQAAAGRSGHTLAEETVADATMDALVAAHSRALAGLSADIAAAIRAAARTR